jgi:hypothetical protein
LGVIIISKLKIQTDRQKEEFIMFLKFKVKHDSELDTEEWKVYECKNYSYRTFTFDKILDFLIYIERQRQRQINGQLPEEKIDLPYWLEEADLLVVPEIDNKLVIDNRIVSDKHTNLLLTKCVHFQITPMNSLEVINAITIKDVYVLGDKGQTVDRIVPNVLK